MKKTYIIPEILIADCEDAIMLSASQTGAKSGKATYTVDGETDPIEYDSDGY